MSHKAPNTYPRNTCKNSNSSLNMYVSVGNLQMILLRQDEHAGSDFSYPNSKEVIYYL